MNIKPLVLTTVLTILTVNIATADDRLRDIDMDFISLSKLCAPWVAPQTMAAIIKTESLFGDNYPVRSATTILTG